MDVRIQTNSFWWGSIGIICLFILSSALHPRFSHRKPVIQYTTTKSVDVTVYLVYSENDQPAYYTTRLQSPVCMENLCNPIDIQVEWDLLGDFKGYIENPDDPLTKFDHEPLTPEDHEKLNKILANKESLLQDYKVEDLVDTTHLIYSEEIDGMTGATSKTFENDIVSGAVHTCYTLWHFVNGDLHNRLLDYTRSILDDDLLIGMIHSGEKNYLEYVLESDSGVFSKKVNNALGALIWDSESIISVKAISTVHDNYWMADSIKNLFKNRFVRMENPVQNALIRHFKNDRIPEDYLSLFIRLLSDLGENQRSMVYEILKPNEDRLDEGTKNLLARILKSDRYPLTIKEYELMSILGIDY